MISKELIINIAKTHRLEPALVLAIVRKESEFNPHAIRFEAGYQYVWDVKRNAAFRPLTDSEKTSSTPPAGFTAVPGSSRATEWVGQKTSWGPMQVMGAVARQQGFSGWFPELCGSTGIEHGCKALVKLYDRFHTNHGISGVIAAYNAGSPRKLGSGGYINQGYVDDVTRFMEEYGRG